MFDDMKDPTADADAELTKVTGEGQDTSAIPDWIKDPAQAYDGVQKLQEKSQQRLETMKSLEQRLQALELEKKQAAEKVLTDNQQWQELASVHLAEVETLKKQLEAVKETTRLEVTNNAILRAAAKLKFIDPGQAAALVDRSKITISEDDAPQGIDDAVADLAKSSPHLLVAATGKTTVAGIAPAGTSQEPDLSWHPLYKGAGKTSPFSSGGLIPPVTKE